MFMQERRKDPQLLLVVHGIDSDQIQGILLPQKARVKGSKYSVAASAMKLHKVFRGSYNLSGLIICGRHIKGMNVNKCCVTSALGAKGVLC